jgi:hypothetical protein
MDPSPRSPYRLFPVRDPVVTELRAEPDRWFVVVSGTRSRTGEPWTLVFERRNDYWISRRDLKLPFDPESAVSGFLFAREGYQDPLDMLRRMNEVVRVEYYRVLQEKIQADRARAELVDEVARLKGECEDLQARLRRKAGRGETTGRRAPAAPRQPPSASRRGGPRRRR